MLPVPEIMVDEKNGLLVLNAAEARVQFVLARVEGGFGSLGPVAGDTRVDVLCAQDWFAPSRGTEILPAALEGMFRGLALRPSCLGRIACVQGPGSFTGIRLALTLGSALRRATGAAIAGINYLQAVAAGAAQGINAEPPCTIRVLTHARRDLLHRQDFLCCGKDEYVPEACSAPEMVTLEQALENFPKGRPAWICGSGVTRNAQALLARLPQGVGRLDVPDAPPPAALLRLGLCVEAGFRELDPLYLRPCDAVDNLPHIAEKRGQSPDEAQARLNELLNIAPGPQQDE